jgi:AhpD family alkylhydroperoxidase
MDDKILARFSRDREKLNDLMLKYSGTNTKRFLNLDWQTYKDGAIPAKTKELMGLAVSLVMRCEDCVLYHLNRCHEEKVTDAELEETLMIGLVVGGSITIPHIRRIWQAWDELKPDKEDI